MSNARERRQIFPGSCDQFIRGLRIGRVGPENHDVGKHGRSVRSEGRCVKGKVRFALVFR